MRCAYCDSYISPYPADGICPNCGAKLPPPPPQPQRPVITRQVPTPPAYRARPVYRAPMVPGVNCCAHCMSQRITARRRGFSWGWGIFWFFIIPVFGIFLGFCGADKQICTCQSCGHKWKR